MNNLLILDVKPRVVKFVPSATGLPQRKGISPGVPECQLKKSQLKSVKSASCVTQLSCVNSVSNVPNVALNLPVGARLQNFCFGKPGWTWVPVRKWFKSSKRATPSSFGSDQNSQEFPQS